MPPVNAVRDLGVIIDSSLTFSQHIDHISRSAMKKVGFLQRFSANFSNPYTLRTLYFSLVLPLLEYASVIWSPNLVKHRMLLERVQHKFLRFAAFKTGCPMSYSNHDYTQIMDRLKIDSLHKRRLVADLTFLFKILNGHICCPEILSKLCLNAPERTLRSFPLFKPALLTTSVGHADPINRISNLANKHSSELNFFNNALAPFLTAVRKITPVQ